MFYHCVIENLGLLLPLFSMRPTTHNGLAPCWLQKPHTQPWALHPLLLTVAEVWLAPLSLLKMTSAALLSLWKQSETADKKYYSRKAVFPHNQEN